MQKSLLTSFINKYNLAGAIETVLWTVGANKLSTKFISDDSSCFGVLTLKEIDSFEEGKYGIKDTSQLKSLLSVLNDDVTVSKYNVNNKNVALLFSDKKNTVNFVLSEPNNIPVVPEMENVPDWDLVIPFSTEFINTFSKAKGALKDVETFTILTAKKKTQLILGYAAKINTTRVVIDLSPETYKEISPISFSSRYMNDILSSNKEAELGTLKISSEGAANLTFELEDFETDYILFEIDKSE